MTQVHGVTLNPDGDMVVLAARKGPFEPDSLTAWHNCLHPGSVMLDVGAYTGLYALYAAKQGATVYAFEPHPENYHRMLENIQANRCSGLINAFNAAVSAEPGTCAMADLHGRPRLTSAGKAQPGEGSTEMITIDGLNLPRCDAIKIDVEGGELDVLRGASQTIAGQLPCLIIEANTDEDGEALNRELRQYGYRTGVRADVRNLIYMHPDR